ncbi:MAG: hypothetical protein QM714_12505 [Nocardioides sp.]|uniref:hypothetical protein n=1 Tax=Nocardioides sp. TaxID=35761 RepID=UPI0039E37D79
MSEQSELDAQIMFTEWLETLRTQVIESVNGVALRGSRPVPVGAGVTRLATSPTSLVGFALRNTNAGVSTLLLRDGFDATGEVIVPITLAPGESVRDWFGPAGVNLSIGLYAELTGSVDGAVFLRGAQ